MCQPLGSLRGGENKIMVLMMTHGIKGLGRRFESIGLLPRDEIVESNLSAK